MMVLERWGVAAIVAVGLVLGPVLAAPGQTPTKPSTTHRSKPKVVVRPDSGAPPEQAVQPDPSAPLAQTPNYDPPPPPPRPPDPDPPPPPPVAAAPVVHPHDGDLDDKDQHDDSQAEDAQDKTSEPAKTVVTKTETVKQEPAPPTRPMTPEEQQLEKDSTRLLTLVRELKDEVAKAGVDTLSLSALRKADEIQRISKNLKDRLKSQSQVTPTNTQ